MALPQRTSKKFYHQSAILKIKIIKNLDVNVIANTPTFGKSTLVFIKLCDWVSIESATSVTAEWIADLIGLG